MHLLAGLAVRWLVRVCSRSPAPVSLTTVSPMRVCLSLGDVDALGLPLLLCDLAFAASLALKGLRHR